VRNLLCRAVAIALLAAAAVTGVVSSASFASAAGPSVTRSTTASHLTTHAAPRDWWW